jgi:hypothetical protein
MHGETVQVATRVEAGRDAFNNEIWEEAIVDVENVLVAPSSTDAVEGSLRVDSTKRTLNLYFPKTFTGVLAKAKICIRNEWYLVVGDPFRFDCSQCPTEWNLTCQVEAIDG